MGGQPSFGHEILLDADCKQSNMAILAGRVGHVALGDAGLMFRALYIYYTSTSSAVAG